MSDQAAVSDSVPAKAAAPADVELLKPEPKPQLKPITEFPVLSFEAAVDAAADDVLTKAASVVSREEEAPRALTIDPLIDGVTGVQSAATVSMGERIGTLVRAKYPQFKVQPFSMATLEASPLVFIGTLTGIDVSGQANGAQDSYRLWFTIMDLRSGKIIAKSRARASLVTVDATPAPHFRDSPAWTPDRADAAYIDACQKTKVGDPVPAAFLDRVLVDTVVEQAVSAYEAGRYRDALDLYVSTLALPGGRQLRVYNGIYLASWKLGPRDAAAEAFGDVVDYGIETNHLAVKLLFRPGSTAFWPDPDVSGPYGMWLEEIARRASRSPSCLEITGHTSRTGPEPLNERISLLRAEYIKRRLENEAPSLKDRTIVNGAGSRENLVGTGTDDAIDALDRRVDFKVIPC